MRTPAAALAVTLAVALPLSAQAKTKTRDHVKIVDDTAVASWDYTQGNILTFVNVVATLNDVTENHVKTQDAFAARGLAHAGIAGAKNG